MPRSTRRVSRGVRRFASLLMLSIFAASRRREKTRREAVKLDPNNSWSLVAARLESETDPARE